MNKAILYLIQQAASLMQMPRSHKKNLGNTFDTVASHSHHTAVIAYCLARMEGLSHKEGLEAITTAIFHDLAEARTGDLDFAAKHYSDQDATQAIKDQFLNLPFGNSLTELLEKYEKRESKIAKCAKDADLIQQLYQEWVLAWQGNKVAQMWTDFKKKEMFSKFRTSSALSLLNAMYESNPNSWWWEEFLGVESPKLDYLNGAK